MIPLAPIIASIPSIIKLFDKDERKQGVQELTGNVLAEASRMLGVDFQSKDQLLEHLNANPNEVIKLKQLEQETQLKMFDLDIETIKQVNETMRSESKSEHWIQFGWRPFIGFSFGLYLNSLWLLPLADKTPTTMSVDMILTVGAILGVASWHRGMEKIQKVKR